MTLNLGCLFLLQRLREDPRRAGFACKDRQSAQMLPKPKTTVPPLSGQKCLCFMSAAALPVKSEFKQFDLSYLLIIYRKFLILVEIAQHFFFLFTQQHLSFTQAEVKQVVCILQRLIDSARTEKSVKHDLRHELSLMSGNIFNEFSRALKVRFHVWNSPAFINDELITATVRFMCDFGNHLI